MKAIYSRSSATYNTVSVADKYSKKDFRMLKILNELLEESGPPDIIDSIDLEEILDGVERDTYNAQKNLKRHSQMFPSTHYYLNLTIFLKWVTAEIEEI